MPSPLAHTFSIVARDPSTGEMGVAVQSHWFAVGAIVAWAEAGVGAVATQSLVDPSYGPAGLEGLQAGAPPAAVLDRLLAADVGRDVRQVGMIDAAGRAAAWTGPRCIAAAGHHVGDGFAVQANMMVDDTIWPAMATAYTAATGDLTNRLLEALDAAQAAGGDVRGRQSAALVVVAATSTGRPWIDRRFDLRVDDAPDPLAELRRLVGLSRAYQHMNAGDLALERSDTAAARAEYAAAEGLHPTSAEVVFWHAVAVANAGDMGGALPLFRRCFDMDQRWVTLVSRVAAAGLLNVGPDGVEQIARLSPPATGNARYT